MPISLEELKKQREQIAKHLAWLDAKIAELGGGAEAPATKSKVAETTLAVEKNETEPIGDSKKNTDDQKPMEPAPESPALGIDPDAPNYKAKTANELMQAKIGCFAFFVLSVLLFLFLLFGLPYLL